MKYYLTLNCILIFYPLYTLLLFYYRLDFIFTSATQLELYLIVFEIFQAENRHPSQIRALPNWKPPKSHCPQS
jgi:hypothetical protein